MLVDRKHRRRILLLSGTSALFASISSAATLANVNLYQDALPRELLLGTLGFDVVSLAVSLALLLVLRALDRRRERYWLVWIGLQGYLLYAYAIYAFGFVFTSLYFLYLAVVGLSAYALAAFGRALNLAILRHWHAGRLPRRTMGVVLALVAAVFGLVWTAMLIGAIAQDVDLPAATVIVLDLAFALPLLGIVASLLFLRRPMGDLLAPGIFGMAAAITLAVALGEVLRPAFGETFSVAATVPYLLPGLVCLGFAILAFTRVGPAIPRAPA